MSDILFWQRLRDQKLKGGGKVEKESKPAKEDSENSGNSEKEKPEEKPKKTFPKPIKQASKKRAKELRQYAPRKKKFLESHPMCEMQLTGCTGIATELHHKAGRSGKQLLKVEDFCGACHNCHTKATEHSRQAIVDGNSKTRLGKPQKK